MRLRSFLLYSTIGSVLAFGLSACGDDQPANTGGSGPGSGAAGPGGGGPGGSGDPGGGGPGGGDAGGGGPGSGGAGGPGSGGAGGGLGSGGAGGGTTTTCDQIAAAYDAALSGGATCNPTDACHIVNGHCSIGIGGCYHAVNTSVTQAELDALAAQWQAQNCMGPVCDCAPTPLTASCVQGMCVPTK